VAVVPTRPRRDGIRVAFPDQVDTIVLRSAGGEIEVEGRKISSPGVLLTRRGGQQQVVDLAGTE
jgi:hypothetical protein